MISIRMEYKAIEESLKVIIIEQAKHTAMIVLAIKEIKVILVSMPKSELVREPEEVWLLIEDVVKIFKKSARTIYAWRMKGMITCTMIGKTAYFSKKEVEKLLKEGVNS